MVGYVGGEYEISATDACVVWAPTSHGATGLVEVTAWASEAGSAAYYGLVFGGQRAPTEAGAFLVHPESQMFAVFQYSDQYGWTTLVDWTPSWAIHSGATANDLTVRRDGA